MVSSRSIRLITWQTLMLIINISHSLWQEQSRQNTFLIFWREVIIFLPLFCQFERMTYMDTILDKSKVGCFERVLFEEEEGKGKIGGVGAVNPTIVYSNRNQLPYNYQMSEIDLKEPIFEEDLAVSENQSLPANRLSQYFPPEDEPYNFRQSYDPNNQIDPRNRGFRLSETISHRRSSPVKINTNLLKSTQSPYSNLHDSHPPDNQNKSQFSFLQPIAETDYFQCHHKQYTSLPCQICKGTGFVKGDSNLIKFFEYVINFKFGLNQSYSPRKLTKKNKSSVNSFCYDFFNKTQDQSQTIRGTTGNCSFKVTTRHSQKPGGGMSMSSSLSMGRPKPIQRVSFNERSSYKGTKRCNKKDVIQQINHLVPIHQDYVCDGCSAQPIIGYRYHCNDCDDFDFCEECFKSEAHPHPLEKIDKNAKGKQLQNLITLLVEPINSSTRISLRPPPTINVEHQRLKVIKSAIQ